MQEQATDEWETRLAEATARLHEAIEEMNRAFLGGSPIEKDSARDRFDVALAVYTALLDAR